MSAQTPNYSSYKKFVELLKKEFPFSAISEIKKNEITDENSIHYQKHDEIYFALVGDKNDWRYNKIDYSNLSHNPLIIKVFNIGENLKFKELALRLEPEKGSNFAYRYLDIKTKNKTPFEIIQNIKSIMLENINDLTFDAGIKRPEKSYFLEKYVNFKNIEITNENIADYYEFMSDEEKMPHAIELDEIFSQRQTDIMFNMVPANEEDYLEVKSIKGSELPQYDSTIHLYDLTYEQNIFGVKDTLKPIDEYIQDIKASVLYQEYVNTKSVDTNLFLANSNKPLTIKEINLTLYNDESIIMKDFENNRLLSIKKNYDGELMYRIYDENVDYDSELDVVKNPEIALQYGVIEVVEKENEEYDLPKDAIQQIISKVKESVDTSPSIDECIQQIEEEEAAKASVKVGMK